ncbi:MAG: acylneuraminate cytidylyltransferase family protein [Thermodesulfobacteriota bacterium]|nr:acylneuraminate cytidylyltransferase family protein [Thermodesulfobacteriota bacterium]
MKIAIIPARGGSKRIPYKNIIDFCGKPMIAYALEAALNSRLFDKIHVSTDSEKIAQIVDSLGYTIDFMRPAGLADDHTGIIPVLKNVLKEFDNRKQTYKHVLALMPCCPLLLTDDILRGYSKFRSFGGKRPLHVVTPYPVPIEWAYDRNNAGVLIPRNPGAYAVRSQDLKPAYYECGPFSIFHRNHILSETPATDEGFCSITIPRSQAVDIDEPEDLILAESMFRALNS